MEDIDVDDEETPVIEDEASARGPRQPGSH
jgi:hypothetical protein